MNPQWVQTISSMAALFAAMGAFIGGMYLTVTKPLNKRIDDLRTDIVPRLDRIEERLVALERKVDALEIKAWR